MIPPPVCVTARIPRKTPSSSAMCSITSNAPVRSKTPTPGMLRASICTNSTSGGRRRRAGGEAGRMQFGADQSAPTARQGEGTQHRAGATANFQKPERAREEFVRKTHDQLVAGNEPEVRRFQSGKLVEKFRVEAADGVGKLGREHRHAFGLGDDMSAFGTAPARRPDRRSSRSDRFNGIAGKASSQRRKWLNRSFPRTVRDVGGEIHCPETVSVTAKLRRTGRPKELGIDELMQRRGRDRRQPVAIEFVGPNRTARCRSPRFLCR